MKTVFKYVIEPTDEQELRTARLLRILHVAPTFTQDFLHNQEFGVPGDRRGAIEAERIAVWALVDTGAEQATRFFVHGTGHPVGRGEVHQGTAVMPSGLVWHVFVIPETTFAIELR